MNFQDAKSYKASLAQIEDAAGKILNSFPKGPMGLTPDHVKASPEWKAAYQAHARAFAALRDFNGKFVKAFKKELAAERKARYQI